jgi:hypothetical protein
LNYYFDGYKRNQLSPLKKKGTLSFMSFIKSFLGLLVLLTFTVSTDFLTKDANAREIRLSAILNNPEEIIHNNLIAIFLKFPNGQRYSIDWVHFKNGERYSIDEHFVLPDDLSRPLTFTWQVVTRKHQPASLYSPKAYDVITEGTVRHSTIYIKNKSKSVRLLFEPTYNWPNRLRMVPLVSDK